MPYVNVHIHIQRREERTASGLADSIIIFIISYHSIVCCIACTREVIQVLWDPVYL
jgi:hypothetical protein